MSLAKGGMGVLIGAIVMIGSFGMTLINSPLVGDTVNTTLVYYWAVGFVAGVIVFGWGLGELVPSS